MNEITILDYFLAGIYIIIIYFFAYKIRNRFYPEKHELRPYFIPGLTVKLIGAVFIGLIYFYYYKGGDTFDYFYHVKLVNNTLKNGIGEWWRAFTNTENLISETERLTSSQKYYTTVDTVTVWQISSIISFFCFNLYLPTVLLIAFISYSGTWQIFRFFAIKYPEFIKQLSFTSLFIPTTIIWGSGLLKDTFCQMAIGWVLISLLLIQKNKSVKIKYIFLFLIGCYLLYKIKIYIFISFIPLLLIYYVFEIFKSISRKRIFIIIIVLLIIIQYLNFESIINYFVAETSKYSLNNIAEYSVYSKEYLFNLSVETEGSSFDLGEFEPTFKGLFSKFFPAVNATLFRPYLWEAKKPFVFLNSIESFIAMIFSILVISRLILRKKNFKLFDNTILFSLAFSFIFAFMIGISTSNFGSLSRYKIPIEPFFYSALIILYLKSSKPNIKKAIEE